MSSSDLSLLGTSEKLGKRRWSLLSKNARYFSRISFKPVHFIMGKSSVFSGGIFRPAKLISYKLYYIKQTCAVSRFFANLSRFSCDFLCFSEKNKRKRGCCGGIYYTRFEKARKPSVYPARGGCYFLSCAKESSQRSALSFVLNCRRKQDQKRLFRGGNRHSLLWRNYRAIRADVDSLIIGLLL